MLRTNRLRSARRLAERKGLTLRKLRGDAGYSLAVATGLHATRPPMIFETLDDALSEVRLR